MALKMHTLALIYIFSISLYALHAETTSAPTPSEAPAPSDPDAKDAEVDEDAMPPSDVDLTPNSNAPTPTPFEDDDDGPVLNTVGGPTSDDEDVTSAAGGPTSDDEDVTSAAGGPTSDDEDVTSAAGGPTSDEDEDDISVSENFELSLPDIGVQHKLATSEPDGSKIATKQLQAIEHKINEFKAGLDKRMVDPETSDETKSCLQDCQDKFEAKLDAIKLTLESIDKKDYPKANDCVNVIQTDAETCNECFIEMMAEDEEIRSFEEWIKGVTGECASNLPKE